MVAFVLFTFKIVYFQRFCFRSPFKIGSLRNYSGIFTHADRAFGFKPNNTLVVN